MATKTKATNAVEPVAPTKDTPVFLVIMDATSGEFLFERETTLAEATSLVNTGREV